MSTKFFFSYEYEWPGQPKLSNTMTVSNVESLYTVLDNFKRFLMGCGYHIDGELEIVSEEDENWNDYSSPESSYDVNLSVSNYGAAQPVEHGLQDVIFSPYVNDSIISFNPEDTSEDAN